MSGRLLLQPWYDSAALPFVTNLFFRLSRGWAAVLAGERQHVGNYVVRRLLTQQDRYRAAERDWTTALFGQGDPGPVACSEAEAARRTAAQRHMAQRNWLLPSATRWPQVRLEPASAEAVEAAHGQRLADWAHAYPTPAPVRIEASRQIPHWRGRQYWLRHASPHAGDTAWARVIEPADRPPRATLIYLHGVCMENEMWPELDDPIARLAGQGLRVILDPGTAAGALTGGSVVSRSSAGCRSGYSNCSAPGSTRSGAWLSGAAPKGKGLLGSAASVWAPNAANSLPRPPPTGPSVSSRMPCS